MSTKTRMMSLIMPAMAREVEDEEGHEAEAEEKVVDGGKGGGRGRGRSKEAKLRKPPQWAWRF